MRALAIDTSTYRAEVALWAGGALVTCEENLDPVKHAESLFGLIDRAFARTGWKKTELDLVVPCIGPGSFTGARVGLAAAKGIALALDRPIVGVSGLEAMASSLRQVAPERASDADAVLALLDARKGEVFWAAYGPKGELLAGPGHVSAGRIGEILATLSAKKLVVGQIAGELGNSSLPSESVFRSAATDLPDVGEVARLGVRKFEERGPDDLAALEPIYVRPPDITLPKPK
jgi:tRNA threonylcarbamoyladenosine biosynthesis protein TsaB